MAAHASESPPVITICPQCQLPLAVTAADLRIAQGQVRCGRCAAVFNALASLYEPGGAAGERRLAVAIEAPRTAGQAEAGGDAPRAPSPGKPAGAAPATPQQAPSPPAFWSPVASSPFAPRRIEPAPPTTRSSEPTVALAAPSPGPAPAPESAPAPASTPEPARPAVADTTILGPNSGLFRTPPRDDVPRFDDTHGADDWPADLPEQLAAEAAASGALEREASTDAFRREPAPEAVAEEPRTDALALPAEAMAPLPPEVKPDPSPAPRATVAAGAAAVATGAVTPGRSWDIDTMTAAELAALVARGDDEPPELASIRIAVDDASEITVLPGDVPVTEVARPVAPDASLPRLLEPRADDPDLPGARVAAEERRAALPEAGLRWLELEPAAPLAAEPGPDDFAAALGEDAEPEAPGRMAGTAATAPAVAPAPIPIPSPAPAADAMPATDAALVDELVAGAPARPVTPRWMLGGTVALALLLVAQLAHRYREDLVEVPLLQAPLTGLYAALGMPLQPRWDVGRYEVRQQGVVAEPVAAGTLTVRASIRNGAARAQPAPLLRVILQDRFGNRIATRDLTPREYGGTAALAPAPMLAPGQRIDAEVSLLDPGGDAVGFELDVCLRRADASVRCANDAPAANG